VTTAAARARQPRAHAAPHQWCARWKNIDSGVAQRSHARWLGAQRSRVISDDACIMGLS
jgi:hypothetical protein